MLLRSWLICARLTGAALSGARGIVTLGSGPLPAGVPAAVVCCCHRSHSDSRSWISCAGPSQDGPGTRPARTPAGLPAPAHPDLFMLTGLGEHHQRHDRRRARLAVVARVLLRVVLWPVASRAAGPVRRVPFCDAVAVSRRYCYPGAAVRQVLCPHPPAVRRGDGLHYRESEPGRLACAFVARG